MTRRVFAAAFVVALALMLTLAIALPGCWNPFSSDDDNRKHREPTLSLVPRTSPENVLYDFRAIYDGADAFVKTEADTLYWGGMYQALFHPDTFRFYFLEGDKPPDLPDPWWGLSDEVACFEEILRQKARGTVDDVILTWTVNPSEPDSLHDPEAPQQLLHPTWRHIHVTGILLDVVVGDMIFRVPNGIADFYFAPDPADSTLWVVTEWHDDMLYGGSPPGRNLSIRASYMTWGSIKVRFR